jgi:hypothetical protein
MIKIFQILIVFLFFISTINAQKGDNFLKLSGGVELTTGHFADGYSTGWGIYATDYYNISKDASLLLSTGITSFKVKNGTGKAGMSLSRFGIRQFVSNGFYFQGDAGIGIGLNNFDGPARFTFGFGPGYLFKSKRGSGFDLSARLNRGFSRTWIGLGAGYQFKL